MSRLVAALAGFLGPADRECVCGDVEELQLSALTAAANILSLVVRRQCQEWSHWGRWLALIGVAGVAGSSLSSLLAQVQVGIALQLRTYMKYGVAYEPGGVSTGQQIAYTATLTVALLLWLWGCGSALALLSGRVLWMTGFAFYAVVRDSWMVRMALSGNIKLRHGIGVTMLLGLLPFDPITIAFLVAFALGVRSARKGYLRWNEHYLPTAVSLALVVLLAWMKSWFTTGFAHWSGRPYVPTTFVYQALPWLVGAWPVLLIPYLNGSFLGSAKEGRLA